MVVARIRISVSVPVYTQPDIDRRTELVPWPLLDLVKGT